MKSSRKKNRRFTPEFASKISVDGQGEHLSIIPHTFNKAGDAVGYTKGGKLINVAFGIPGEKAIVEVLGEKDGDLYGKLISVENKSEHRTDPECAHFGVCGGCQLQHIKYDQQLLLKKNIVVESLERLANLVTPPVTETLPSPSSWHYRNNARFTVRNQGKVGFTNWITHRFEPIEECKIVDLKINEIKRDMEGLSLADTSQLSIRVGANTESYMVQPDISEKQEKLKWQTGQKDHLEKILGLQFKISAPSFFQVNTKQAEKMISIVRKELNPLGNEILLDAYAGVGVFAGLLSPYYREVLAVEESNSAIQDAQLNLSFLGNITIIEGKTENILSKDDYIVDHVILDPPRSGCEKDVISALIKNKPKKIVYVSCDPETLSRDLRYFIFGGFRLGKIIPLDMFPQTSHIESVTTLTRGDSHDYILASTSIRRIEILSKYKEPLAVLRPDVDEEVIAGQLPKTISPEDYAQNLAAAKASSFLDESKIPVLGADTIVVGPNDEIMGKPQDIDEARRMLLLLRGKWHKVITGIAYTDPDLKTIKTRFVATEILMREYSDDAIEEYILTEAPFDKAGGYGIQDLVFNPVEKIEGCPLNVIGMPVCAFDQLTESTLEEDILSGNKQNVREHGKCLSIFEHWVGSD